MVEISIGWGAELQCPEADVIKGFIVNAEGLVSVHNQLVDGQGGIVGLNNSVGNLGRRHNGVSVHDSVGVLLSDLGDKKCSHARTSATSKGVSELKSLQTIASLRLLPHDIQDRVNEFGTLK